MENITELNGFPNAKTIILNYRKQIDGGGRTI